MAKFRRTLSQLWHMAAVSDRGKSPQYADTGVVVNGRIRRLERRGGSSTLPLPIYRLIVRFGFDD